MINNYAALKIPRYASKWLVLAIDTGIVMFTFFMVYFIRFNFTLNFDFTSFLIELPIIGVLGVISFLVVGSHKGIIRYTGFKDITNILVAVGLLSLLTSLFVVLNKNFGFIENLTIPKFIVIMHAFMNFVFLSASRVFFKVAYRYISSDLQKKRRILIYGAGDSGIMTQNAFMNSMKQNVKVVAFIDDDKSKVGNSINGTPIFCRASIDKKFIEKFRVDEVIISIQKISTASLRKSIDELMDIVSDVKIVPPVDRWINGELSVNQIKQVQLEDLLERNPININNKELLKEFSGKTVLVTGAAGSIGSEISRQLVNYNLNKLVLLDIAESPLYNLQQELFQSGILDFHPVIADIRDQHSLNSIFEQYRPDIIFHAAAYKHVPLMEENPYEAVKINLLGTRLLANTAIKFNVDKFVYVSTDKAVNPTNVMGATKRAAEIYIGSLQKETKKTKFITTRFGNVLGSNGSVIPLFKKQIENGGPLTVTHREVTRYFMTIPEASELVLEAGTMGRGGEIFIFDMGQRIKIYDLAKNMIKLSGLRYPEDIKIEFTGLRPGEKLYEELLANGENTLPTYHEKIMISKVKDLPYDKLKAKIEALCILNLFNDKNIIVSKLKEIVPEYISRNSDYEKLDAPVNYSIPRYSILHSLNFNPYNNKL